MMVDFLVGNLFERRIWEKFSAKPGCWKNTYTNKHRKLFSLFCVKVELYFFVNTELYETKTSNLSGWLSGNAANKTLSFQLSAVLTVAPVASILYKGLSVFAMQLFFLDLGTKGGGNKTVCGSTPTFQVGTFSIF